MPRHEAARALGERRPRSSPTPRPARRGCEHVPLANVAAAQARAARPARGVQPLPGRRRPTPRGARGAARSGALRADRAGEALHQPRAADDRGRGGGLRRHHRRCGSRCASATSAASMRALTGDAGMRAQAALVCQRVARLPRAEDVPPLPRLPRRCRRGDWRALHEAYAAAEKLDVAEDGGEGLPEPRHPRHLAAHRLRARGADGHLQPERARRSGSSPSSPSCSSAGRRSSRSLPSRSPKARACRRWSPTWRATRCPERGATAPRRASRATSIRASSPRACATASALLRKGESPAKLALGEDCVQPSCEQLLVYLYRQWCQAKPRARARAQARAEPAAEVCTEIGGIHYYISGRAFKAPTSRRSSRRSSASEIATFGRVSTREDDDYSSAHGFLVEHWRHRGRERAGHAPRAQGRGAGQAPCARAADRRAPGDGKQFMLGQVRWLMQAENGDLHAGVKLLPGLPSAIAVRPTGLNVQSETLVPALVAGRGAGARRSRHRWSCRPAGTSPSASIELLMRHRRQCAAHRGDRARHRLRARRLRAREVEVEGEGQARRPPGPRPRPGSGPPGTAR